MLVNAVKYGGIQILDNLDPHRLSEVQNDFPIMLSVQSESGVFRRYAFQQKKDSESWATEMGLSKAQAGSWEGTNPDALRMTYFSDQDRPMTRDPLSRIQGQVFNDETGKPRTGKHFIFVKLENNRFHNSQLKARLTLNAEGRADGPVWSEFIETEQSTPYTSVSTSDTRKKVTGVCTYADGYRSGSAVFSEEYHRIGDAPQITTHVEQAEDGVATFFRTAMALSSVFPVELLQENIVQIGLSAEAEWRDEENRSVLIDEQQVKAVVEYHPKYPDLGEVYISSAEDKLVDAPKLRKYPEPVLGVAEAKAVAERGLNQDPSLPRDFIAIGEIHTADGFAKPEAHVARLEETAGIQQEATRESSKRNRVSRERQVGEREIQ
jgi:hypothetical protein